MQAAWGQRRRSSVFAQVYAAILPLGRAPFFLKRRKEGMDEGGRE